MDLRLAVGFPPAGRFKVKRLMAPAKLTLYREKDIESSRNLTKKRVNRLVLGQC